MSDVAVGLTADKVCDSALAFESVCRSEKGAGEILSGITARFAASRLVALVGADGAGKTTLMRIAAGILQPSAGHVLVFGEELYGKKLAHLQKQCGYMPQKFGLYEDLSVAENFKLYADLFGLSEEQRKERTKELLEMTALTAFTERPAGKLSGGMKQKLGLACALLNRPRILLLDEPTVGVDPLSRRDLWRILRENAAARDMLIVVATTYMDEAALCDDVIILEEGHMRVTGTPESIARHALGCTFFAEQKKNELPVRLLQDRLIADTEHFLDAVPEAAGVRLLTNGTSDVQKLQALYPGVRFTERPSTLEDGYLVLRKEFLGDWRLEAEESLSLFESSATADSDPAIAGNPDSVIQPRDWCVVSVPSLPSTRQTLTWRAVRFSDCSVPTAQARRRPSRCCADCWKSLKANFVWQALTCDMLAKRPGSFWAICRRSSRFIPDCLCWKTSRSLQGPTD